MGYGLLDDGGVLNIGVLDPRTRRPVRTSRAQLSRSLPGPASMLDRRPLRCPSLAERHATFPATEGVDASFAYEAGAWAPIVTEGEALGFLSVHHRDATDLTPDELALVEAAAQMCSQALVRARLYEREAAARGAAEQAAERLALLADVTEALEQEQEFSARLQRLMDTLVPRIADFATVEALRVDGRLELLALHHVEPDKVESLRRLREEHALDADAPVGMGHVIRTGQSLLLGQIPDELTDDVEDPGRRLLQDIATRSFLAVPLATHEGTIGALMLCTSVSGRVYAERDRELAEELADRIALVLENARLFDEQRRIARTLQLGPARRRGHRARRHHAGLCATSRGMGRRRDRRRLVRRVRPRRRHARDRGRRRGRPRAQGRHDDGQAAQCPARVRARCATARARSSTSSTASPRPSRAAS